MKRTVLRRMVSWLLALCMTAAWAPWGALAAEASAPALPAGNMWAYVSNHGKWGVGTEAHALKLYQLADSSAVSGSAATSIEDGGIYLIGDTAPVGSSDKYRKMYAQAGATDSCGESTVPGDPYTLPSGCQSHKTNHMFQLNVDSDGWYTIKSVSNHKYLDISSCAVGTYDQISLTATPTKFAVVKAEGDGMFTIAAAVLDPDAPPDLSDLTEPLYGAIVEDDLQYVQADFNAALAANAKTATLNAWRNDAAVSQIFLAAGQTALTDVTAAAGDFSDGAGHTIPADNVDLSFIKVVQAYTGMNGWGDSHGVAVPEGSRKDAAEVLMGDDPVDMAAGKVQGLWVTVNVPKDAAAGTYQGQITVTAAGLTNAQKLTFTYTLNVASPVLPDATQFKDGFDIELWQNPYASAEYYNVTPFSTEHFAILKPIMEKYKSVGGHAITTTIAEDAWARQTYSANEVHIPSMVAWSKNAAGEWVFDYTDFDKWIAFNINEIGIGDKIVCYSTAPWTNEIRYLDANGTKQVISKDSTAAWNEGWTAFLTDLMAHMKAKGWKDRTYIGIDERGIDDAALTLIESVVDTDGKPFKKAGAMDHFTTKHDLAMRMDDLNVGSIAVKGSPTAFASLLAEREAAGLRTTVYSCTGHIPGNFSLSAPGESYWTMLYSYSVGGAGFLRWAYDSWVADPLRDTSHAKFESGDCFLIFPDEKTAQNPVVHSSLRLEKMAQGVRDVNKLMTIRDNCPAMESAVDTLAATVKPSYDSSTYYLTDAGKTALAADMRTLRQGIVSLTAEYEERLATGDTKKLNIRPQNVPLVTLPEQYQGDVYGPILDTSKQYYGQPDTITLTDGTLVTVFPQGHGHGPLLMMKSDNRGENWEEIETPASWAASLETPTMYRLNFTDGSTRYVMITARPNWDTNAGSGKGGWDASISDDGIHWSESSRYCEDVGYTIVAMASLVQLKDENGNWIDKWMGVFHNYGFENFKTYLTFDEDGNMQWSTPEKYLADYRAQEEKYHICEVGMFRSPDGGRIMALARSDYHNNVHASTMFWSDDEGETWTKPMEIQGALAGERHKALYDPISGRLVITFREIIWDTNGNGVFEGGNDWLAGDWIAWVGTYEDLMERNEGQYRILLDEDWANNTYSGDTGYSGMAVYPDGTFVLDTYGHWDKEYSQGQGSSYNVRTDRCWIRRAKFKLSDIDALYKTRMETEVPTEEIPSAVLVKNAKANSEQNPASGSDGLAAWAFDDSNHWWHGNYGNVTAENVDGRPSATNHVWIQTGFDEAREIAAVSYQPRGNGACRVKNYELQYANLNDPTATPADSDFRTVKTGTMAATDSQQTITLDQPVTATHIRLVATGEIDGANKYVTAKRIRVYAVGEAAHRSDAARLTSLSVNGSPVTVNGADLGAVSVAAGTDSVSLAATYSDKAKLNVVVNGLPADKDQPISLTGDVTLVKLRVVAEDTVTTNVYDLAIVKQNDANAQLRQLSLGTLKLYPAFDPEVTEYYAVAYGNKSAALTATAAQPGAALSYEAVADEGTGTGAVNAAACRFFKDDALMEGGKLYNTVRVTVAAPNGSATKTYTVKVEVRESAYLSDLGWSAIVGNTPIRDRAWGYNEMALIGAEGAKLSFDKGLGARANTVVEYDLSQWGFDTLETRVGVSYAQRTSANVPALTFRVELDGTEAAIQTSTKDAAAPDTFTVALNNARKLTLSTIAATAADADGNWADARLFTTIPSLGDQGTPIEDLAFADGETHTIYVNQSDPDHTVTLRPAVTPVGASETLRWSSSDTSVATVNDGVVTAVAPGTATITVSNTDGTITADCQVVVKQKIAGQVELVGDAKLEGVLTARVNSFAQEVRPYLSYQWAYSETANGALTPIAGQTAGTFTIPLDADYVGKFITVTVTASGDYAGSSSAVTEAVEKADGPALAATPTHENVSAEGERDGKITGLLTGRHYEYLLWDPAQGVPGGDARWEPFFVEGNEADSGNVYGTAEITGLGVGSYLVRRAEDATHKAGAAYKTITIAVRDSAVYDVTNPNNFPGGSVRVGRSQIPGGDTVRIFVTPDAGYQLKENSLKAVTADNEEYIARETEPGVYTFQMPEKAVTISAVFEAKTYAITHGLEHITCDMGDRDHTATHGAPFSITLTAEAGYEMPRSIEVYDTGEFEASGRKVRFPNYTYLADPDDDAARIVTFASGVDRDLTIEATALPETYTVVYALGAGLRAPNAAQTAAYGADFTAVLEAASGYGLPGEVTATVDGRECGLVYDPQTGTLTISGAQITGNVVITASGVARGASIQTVALVGPARVGRTLTVNTVPVDATARYRWLRVENGVETEIPGATASRYVITSEDEGKQIRVWVTGDGNYSGELTSAPTSVILPAASPFVFVEGVRLDSQDLTLTAGNTARLTAAVTPEDATSPILFWASGNDAIATVDQNGVVTARSQGMVTVTVSSTDQLQRVSAVCHVTVEPAPSRPSGGGGSSAPAETTTTETRGDGAKVTTVTKPDGTRVETVERPDGTKSETVTAKSGAVTVTVTDATGETVAKVELPAAVPAPETRFEDVPVGHWADRAIHNAAALKLVNGIGGNKYDMVSPMTRGSLATVLHRLSQGKTDYNVTFRDVAEGKYYTEGVAWAAETGVVKGFSADIFAPDQIITREQLAVMLCRYANLLGLDTTARTERLWPFADGADTAAWAAEGVAWCVEKNILQGKGGNALDPTANVTRAEVAVMLDRFIALLQ